MNLNIIPFDRHITIYKLLNAIVFYVSFVTFLSKQ
jgi:hypothetical protein